MGLSFQPFDTCASNGASVVRQPGAGDKVGAIQRSPVQGGALNPNLQIGPSRQKFGFVSHLQLQMRPPLKDGIDRDRLCIHVDTPLKRAALREGSPRQAFHRTVTHVPRPGKRHGVGRQLVRGDLHARCIELVGQAVHFAHELSEGKRAVQGPESTGRVVLQLASGVHLSGHRQHGLKFVGDAREPGVEGGARIERGRAIPLEVGAGQGTKGTFKGPPRSLGPELVRGPLPLALGVGHGAFGGAHALHGHGEACPSRGHLKGIFSGGPSGIDAAVGPGGFEVHAVVECNLALPRGLRPNPFDGALAQGGDGDGPSFEFLTASCPCPTRFEAAHDKVTLCRPRAFISRGPGSFGRHVEGEELRHLLSVHACVRSRDIPMDGLAVRPCHGGVGDVGRTSVTVVHGHRHLDVVQTDVSHRQGGRFRCGGIGPKRGKVPASLGILGEVDLALNHVNGPHLRGVSKNAPQVQLQPHTVGAQQRVALRGNGQDLGQVDADVWKSVPPGQRDGLDLQFALKLGIDGLHSPGFPDVSALPGQPRKAQGSQHGDAGEQGHPSGEATEEERSIHGTLKIRPRQRVFGHGPRPSVHTLSCTRLEETHSCPSLSHGQANVSKNHRCGRCGIGAHPLDGLRAGRA